MRLKPIILVCLLCVGMSACAVEQRRLASSPLSSIKSNEAAKASEASQKLYLDLINRMIAQGSYDAALAHLDEYRLRVFYDPMADLMRADVLSRLGRDKEAATVLRPYLNSPKNDDRTAKANKIAGRIYANRKNWTEAAKYYERARQASPSDPSVLNNLGYTLAQANEYKKAIQVLRQAYELSPDSEQIRNNLILAYYHGGKKRTAKSLFDDLQPVEKEAISQMIRAWPDAPPSLN